MYVTDSVLGEIVVFTTEGNYCAMNCISDHSLVCVIEKCISVDIVISNVPRKYAILTGYKIVMNQRSVCTDS